MTTPSRPAQSDTTLTRDLIYAARYYLGRPRTWMILAAIAVVTGLVFNWNWMVAAGLAPILLSILPCLIMCVFGVCLMCRSAKEPAAAGRTAAQVPPSAVTIDRLAPEATAVGSGRVVAQSTAAAAPEISEPAALPSCCHSPDETKSAQTINLQATEERKYQMRNFKKSVFLALVAGAALIAAPSLYAQGDQPPSGPKTDQPAMQGSMMGQGGMGGMMNMMQQMSQMMDHCNKMMSEHRSHDGGGKTAPSSDKKG